MVPEIPPEELSACLDGLIEQLLESSGVERPPVDALVIARALGIVVAVDNRQQGRARYVRLRSHTGHSPQATILFRNDPRAERRQWAIAHEIGEHVAHRLFSELMIDPREAAPTARETVSNYLASRLLLPSNWFQADAFDCGWDLLDLKAIYRTASHELIVRRMLDFSPWVIVSILDQQKMTFRRSNIPGQIPAMSRAEKTCMQTAYDENRPEGITQGTQSIQAWPVHEDGFKREILRTEVNLEMVG